MFYTLVDVHLYNGTWVVDPDIPSFNLLTIEEIYETYQGCVIALQRPNITNTFYLDLFTAHAIIDDPEMTVLEWLESIGSSALPTTIEGPYEIDKYVKYSDAVKANYQMKTISGDRHPTVPVPESERTDILLSRSDRDYQAMAKYCMVSVNGLMHRVVAETDGLRVINGWRSAIITGDHQVGIYSFLNVGALEYIPIKSSMVERSDPTVPLRKKALIRSQKDFTNKTVLLVIGGFLHVLDNVYQVVEGGVEIDTARYRIATRLYDALATSELKEVVKVFRHQKGKPIDRAVLESDEFYRRYLSDPAHSFLVVIDNPNVFAEIQPVFNTRLGSTYISKVCPDYPLVVGVGRMGEYWSLTDNEDNKVIRLAQSMYRNFAFETTDLSALDVLDATLDPSDPYSESPAHYLKIYTRTITVSEDDRPLTDDETEIEPEVPEGVDLLLTSGFGSIILIDRSTVHTWGDGGAGQISNKITYADVVRHDPKYPTNAKKVIATAHGTMALTNDGALTAIVTESSTFYGIPGGLTNVNDFSLSVDGKAAIVSLSNGSVIVSDAVTHGFQTKPDDFVNLKAVAATGVSVAGIKPDDTMVVWHKAGEVGIVNPSFINVDKIYPVTVGNFSGSGYVVLDKAGNITFVGNEGSGDIYYERQPGDQFSMLPSWLSTIKVKEFISLGRFYAVISRDDEIFMWGTIVNTSLEKLLNVPQGIQGNIATATIESLNGPGIVALLKDGSLVSWGHSTSGVNTATPARYIDGYGDIKIDLSDYY